MKKLITIVLLSTFLMTSPQESKAGGGLVGAALVSPLIAIICIPGFEMVGHALFGSDWRSDNWLDKIGEFLTGIILLKADDGNLAAEFRELSEHKAYALGLSPIEMQVYNDEIGLLNIVADTVTNELLIALRNNPNLTYQELARIGNEIWNNAVTIGSISKEARSVATKILKASLISKNE